MTPPPAVVEMLGLPASGKTTVRARLGDELAKLGLRPIGFPQDGRELALRGWAGPVVRRFPGSWHGPAGWLVYRVRTGWLAAMALLTHPRAALSLLRFQRRRPSQMVRRERRAGYWYLRHLGDHGLFTRTALPGEVWLVDEGFAHRVVSLFTSHLGREATEDSIAAYLAAAPAPDLVVHVTAPVEVCLDRLTERGVWDWLRPLGAAGLTGFIEGASQAIDTTRRFADSRWTVIEIDNTQTGTPPVTAAVEQILELGSNAASNPARSPRVLMVTRLFHPWVGGMERQALKLARALADDGVEVRIVTGHWFKGTPRRERIEGVDIFRNHTLWEGFGVRGLRRIGGYVYMLSLAWHLWIERNSYDLIHVHGLSYHTYVARLVGSRAGKPVIVKLANSGSASDITKLESGQHLAGTGWMLPGALRCDRIVALNPTIADELRLHGVDESRIVHIPNGVSVPIVDRDYVERPETRLLYLGRLHPQKDLTTLLEAVGRLLAAGDRVTLELVGDGPDRSRLEGEVASRGLADSVNFRGERPDPSTALAGADIMVLPSLAEGLSNALLEAMASGLPVVVSAIAGNLLLVEEGRTGLTFPPGDAQALAGALRMLVRDPGLRKELATNARGEIDARYSIGSVASRYRQLYATLLGDGR